LVPQRALKDGPIEQNQARELALAAFPPEARLRKAGMEIHRSRLTLSFDFPARAQIAYADEIEQLMEQTGWDVQVNPSINQQALGFAVNELLPEGGRLIKGPSFFMDRGEVAVDVAGVEDPRALAAAFLDLTGFRLLIGGTPSGEAATAGTVSVQIASSSREQMEINAAYGLVRQALEPLGLHKVGLKQGTLILTFISPQVGEHHHAIIHDLAEETGYPMSIHPHPNQQQILQIAGQLARSAGWQVVKGPGIHVDRGEISMKLLHEPDAAAVETVQAQMIEQTGYTLVVGV
jgi:hypothetical protein